MVRRRKDFLGASLLENPSEIHHSDTVGKVADYAQVVGDEEVCHTQPSLDFLQEIQHLEFVWVTSKCKGEVECIGNTRTVDGKSILGILSLNLPEPITVVFHDVYGNEDFLKEVKRWVVE